jgi:hypothetical protein
MSVPRIRPQKNSKTCEKEAVGAFDLQCANFGTLLRRTPPEKHSASHTSRKNFDGPQRPVPKRECSDVNARIHDKHEDQVAPLPVAFVYGPAFFFGVNIHIGPIEEPTEREVEEVWPDALRHLYRRERRGENTPPRGDCAATGLRTKPSALQIQPCAYDLYHTCRLSIKGKQLAMLSVHVCTCIYTPLSLSLSLFLSLSDPLPNHEHMYAHENLSLALTLTLCA